MRLKSLGYVGVSTTNLEDWNDYGTRFLGMQVVDRSTRSIAFRIDDRRQRLHVEKDGRSGCRYFGWEVADGRALEEAGMELEAAGVLVRRGESALADQRRVKEVIYFRDPDGNTVEIFFGPERADADFRPERPISGFRTGTLGLGHVVLMSNRLDEMRSFYQDVLGFHLSDFALRPFEAYFFHINARHHSFALINTGRVGVHHLMVELMNLDDVGQAYDLAQQMPGNIGATLGRHTNDLMTSFYSWTPSKFMLEYGWGGRDIDPLTWKVEELVYGPSLWGHDRTWLDDASRALSLDMRLSAAASGQRAPVQVLPNCYNVVERGR